LAGYSGDAGGGLEVDGHGGGGGEEAGAAGAFDAVGIVVIAGDEGTWAVLILDVSCTTLNMLVKAALAVKAPSTLLTPPILMSPAPLEMHIQAILGIKAQITFLALPFVNPVVWTAFEMHVEAVLGVKPFVAVVTVIVEATVLGTVFQMLVEGMGGGKVSGAFETVVVGVAGLEMLSEGSAGGEVAVAGVAEGGHFGFFDWLCSSGEQPGVGDVVWGWWG